MKDLLGALELFALLVAASAQASVAVMWIQDFL